MLSLGSRTREDNVLRALLDGNGLWAVAWAWGNSNRENVTDDIMPHASKEKVYSRHAAVQLDM